VGIFGTAIFFGDGVITPAVSVLSAVEGLEVAAPALHRFIVPVTLIVLTALFAAQRFGTAAVGQLFGPVTLVWFVALAALGVPHIVAHPQVLAAGDVAAYHEDRPKSGVYAVKAGPVLADNLRALCEGRAPRPWTPQRSALYLIATGDRQALASWGRWSCSGPWVWRWKDWIDRRFMRRFGAAL